MCCGSCRCFSVFVYCVFLSANSYSALKWCLVSFLPLPMLGHSLVGVNWCLPFAACLSSKG